MFMIEIVLLVNQVSINRYISIPNGIKEVRVEIENGDVTTTKMVVP